jgi:KDO2-lipid IV(A) lauroyltransferase
MRALNVVEAARARQGDYFLTPHLGCFEISALYGAQRNAAYDTLPSPKQVVEPLMVRGRSRGGPVAPANLRGVRLLYKALARGEAIGLPPTRRRGWVKACGRTFFGRPAYAMTLVRRLQQTSGACAIMALPNACRWPGLSLASQELAAELMTKPR